MIISQYDIVHISFCAQDPDDMNVFAYITRDQHTMKSYCHVFRAETEVNLFFYFIFFIYKFIAVSLCFAFHLIKISS